MWSALSSAQEGAGGLDAPQSRPSARSSYSGSEPESESESGAESDAESESGAESESESGAESESEPELWTPRVELGYTFVRLRDGHGGGQVHGGRFGGFLPVPWARLGASAELGIRRYALGSDDAIIRFGLEGGVQHARGWGPLHPFVSVQATFGLALTERFSTTLREPLRGLGLAVGADLRIAGPAHVGVSIAFMRIGLGDLAHNTAELQIRFGL